MISSKGFNVYCGNRFFETEASRALILDKTHGFVLQVLRKMNLRPAFRTIVYVGEGTLRPFRTFLGGWIRKFGSPIIGERICGKKGK